MFYFLGRIDENMTAWKRSLLIITPLLLPLLAFWLQIILQDHLKSQKFILFYPAVLLAGWLSGYRGSIFATLLSLALVWFFLLDADHSKGSLNNDALLTMIVFSGIGFTISHYLAMQERLLVNIHLKAQELEQANEARLSFLAHVSHEIRTPLNAMLGFAQLIHQDIQDPLHQSMVQRILTSGEYLLALLNKILDFKRMEAHQIELDLRSCYLPDLIQEIETTLLPSATGKGLALRFELPREALQFFKADALRLKQIFYNLCTNAIKFTERGSVNFRMRILKESPAGCVVLFEVQDTGIGMEEGTLSILFKPFVQADASIAGRFGGSGLGLSIVKQLVDMMGGQIGVQSRMGHGTLFWVELPFEYDLTSPQEVNHQTAYPSREEDEKKLPERRKKRRSKKASSSTNEQKRRLQGLRVLVAEDNPINIELLERVLLREGAVCEGVSNGKELLDRLQDEANLFDVLLVDLHMPVLNGIDAARAIRAQPNLKNYPVLAYTAENRDLLAESDLCELFDGSIEKPIQLETLVLTLSKFIINNSNNNFDIPYSPPTEDLNGGPPSFVDIKRFESLFGSDQSLFASCYQQFKALYISFGKDLELALEVRDPSEALSLLHDLRGVASNLGFSALSGATKALELSLKEKGTKDYDRTLRTSLESELRLIMLGDGALHETIQPIQQNQGSQNDRIYSLDHLATLLSESKLEALDIVESLKPRLLDSLGARETGLLMKAVYELQFEKALALLENTSKHQPPVRSVTAKSGRAS